MVLYLSDLGYYSLGDFICESLSSEPLDKMKVHEVKADSLCMDRDQPFGNFSWFCCFVFFLIDICKHYFYLEISYGIKLYPLYT